MSFTTRSGSAFFKRPLALLGATALSVGAMVPLAGTASAAPVRDLASTCAGLTANQFNDLGGYDQAARDAINCLAAYEITRGTSATTYEPGRTVYRYEMALFLDRLLTYVDENSALTIPDDESDAGFDDLAGVPAAGVQAINRLANLEIALGFNADEYRPYAPVLRRQMASFLDRIQDAVAAQAGAEAAYDATEADVTFTDVPSTHPQAEDIYSLQSVGIVQGTTATTFAPNSAVTRAQMAFFLLRHLDENIDADRVESLAEGVDNETLTFTPDEAVTLELPEAGEAPVTRDFIATGLAAGTYQVVLVDAADVNVSAGGEVTFDADENGVVPLSTGVATVGTLSNNGTPVAGTVTATITGVAAGSVVPVIIPAGETLTVDEDGLPEVDFGIAGATTFTNPQAATGGDYTVNVVDVDKDDNRIEGADAYYLYDSNDRFFIEDAAGTPQQATVAQFEAALSSGDVVLVVDYQRTSDLVSEFTLQDVNPAAPTVEAAASTVAGSENDVTVTVTPSGDWDSIVLQRRVGTGSYATIATLTADDDADEDAAGIQYVDADLAPGTYTYQAASVNDGDQSAFVAIAAALEVEQPTTPDTTAPTATDTRVETNTGNALLLDSGDVVRITFSEPVAAVATGDTIRVSDADGTVADLVNVTGNSIFELNAAAETIGGVEYAAGRVLRITVGTPQIITPGTGAGLTIPVTIVTQSGTADAAGNAWSIAGSADVSIDAE